MKCTSTAIGGEEDLPEEFPEGQSPTDLCIAFAKKNFMKYSAAFLQDEYDKLIQGQFFKAYQLFRELFDGGICAKYKELEIAAFNAEACDVNYAGEALRELGVNV